MPLLPLESSSAKMAGGDKIQRDLYVLDKYLIDIGILNKQISAYDLIIFSLMYKVIVEFQSGV